MKSSFRRTGKKGFIQNFIIPVVAVIVLIFVVIIGGVVQTEFNTEIQSDDSFSDISKEETQYLTDNYSSTTDNLVPILLIAYVIISVLSAIAIRMSPVFIFVTLFLVLALLIFPMLVSNLYIDLVSSPDITIEDQFPISNFILLNFPFIYIGYMLIIGLTWIFADRLG